MEEMAKLYAKFEVEGGRANILGKVEGCYWSILLRWRGETKESSVRGMV